MIRTANPALNSQVFAGMASTGSSAMTINGTVMKTGFLLLVLVVSAGYTWDLFLKSATPSAVTPWIVGGAIGGLVLALITFFRKQWAPYTSPLYAACEGLFLGAISAMFEARFPGVVIQAVGLTFGTLFALLCAYRMGIIRATEKFKLGVFAATGGIFFIYFISMILGFFGVNFPMIHSSGPFGIIFSLFVVVIAALNLVLDFDFIENGAAAGAPKYMEWYAAFGLLVTLIWLYIEILRLLSKLRGRH